MKCNVIKLLSAVLVLSSQAWTMDPDLTAKAPAAVNKNYIALKTAFSPLNITDIRLDGTVFKAKFNAAGEQTLVQCVNDALAAAAAHGGGGGGGQAAVIPADALNALGITGLRDDGGTLKAMHSGAEKTLLKCIQDLRSSETAKVKVPADALAAEGLTLFNVQAGVPKVTRAKTDGSGGTEEVNLVDHIQQSSDLTMPLQQVNGGGGSGASSLQQQKQSSGSDTINTGGGLSSGYWVVDKVTGAFSAMFSSVRDAAKYVSQHPWLVIYLVAAGAAGGFLVGRATKK